MCLRNIFCFLFITIFNPVFMLTSGKEDINSLTRCSKFDFEEKLLEKLVRLENKIDMFQIKMNTFEDEIKNAIAKTKKITKSSKESLLAVQSRITNSFQSELERFKDSSQNLMESFKGQIQSVESTVLRNEESLNQSYDRIIATANSSVKELIDRSFQKVALTGCVSTFKLWISGFAIKFDDVRSSVGVQNLTEFKENGIFPIKTDGLYIIDVQISSKTQNGEVGIYINENHMTSIYIGYNKDWETGSGSIAVQLKVGDQVSIKTIQNNLMIYNLQRSCLTIVKV